MYHDVLCAIARSSSFSIEVKTAVTDLRSKLKMLLVLSLAAAAADNDAADTADGDTADTPEADAVNDSDDVDADNNGRSMPSFEDTSCSMASSDFSTISGLLRFSTSRI